ncbi:hypothetical protein K1T71_003349 [Dendrolimus kikuchii]|uniref:Uncharacterized protein n=1 Tax=Dendrolimus kikuchii TaxID=765133 RepID=A0ACC1DBC1_9NEOP|nr:hypothetical protein K1T71_003349 [Dendrolimus kikuchii]
MASSPHRTNQSMETILTFENRDAQSQWSVVWSTSHVPGMDNATGGGPGRRLAGRRKLRIRSLALGALLTMHCRVPASAMTGGVFVFMLFLILAVVILANPMRHFEVYLGQWSISGPGRAFRIIPMLDGIGIAMCINAIVRAINCCTIAAIAAIYVTHSVADAKLPFTYCRDFDQKSYDPILKDFTALRLQEARFSLESVGLSDDDDEYNFKTPSVTVGLNDNAWRNITQVKDFFGKNNILFKRTRHHISVCNETYTGSYPALFRTPAYNFFYVEVVQLRSDYSLCHFNVYLILSLVIVWITLWIFIVVEKILYGKLVWNNMKSMFVAIPWLWSTLLIIIGITNITTVQKSLRKVVRVGAKEILAGIADALEVALYIHSASVGTELIFGKGLNHYASGHIDPHLNGENVWHSGLLLLLTALHSAGAALCALVDNIQPSSRENLNMRESSLWIIPMYSKCTSIGSYTHLTSTLIFGGIMFSYMAVAFMLLKTSLHTIFEYKVKLVFVEQFVAGGLILSCMGLSLIFATRGGIALLESVDAIMTGVAMPLVCLFELVCMLYVYRSHDFVSDMNIATEENACSSRISTQWQIIPLVTVVTIIIKITALVNAELPTWFMYMAVVPLIGVVLAVPMRACHNAYVFLRPTPRRGT